MTQILLHLSLKFKKQIKLIQKKNNNDFFNNNMLALSFFKTTKKGVKPFKFWFISNYFS